MRVLKVLSSVLAASTILGASVVSVSAQDSTPSDNPVLLDQVTISGQEDPTGPVDGFKANRSSSGTRINSRIDEIPIAVEIVAREVIEETNAVRLEDAVLAATGASLGNTFGGANESFIIRGFDAEVAENGQVARSC